MEIEKGKLREIREQDLENILSWRNSERIRNSMIGDHLISWEEHRRWFERQKGSNDKYLLFEYKGKAAGMVYFTAVDNFHGTCWWGFYLGENDLPPKTGLLMGYMGICHAFTYMNIRKICSQALARNNASLNYHLKLGFKQEGYLDKQVLKQDRYEDIVIFGLLAHNCSYYPSRTPEDSRLNPDKSIREQFNLLRVIDNEGYPAFLGKNIL